MIADEISIEEHIEALKNKSFEDQMRVIAALSNEWADAKELTSTEDNGESVREERKANIVKPEVEFSPAKNEEMPVVNSTNPQALATDKHENFFSLFGAWEKSTPDNLIELIREDRLPEREPPNWDTERNT